MPMRDIALEHARAHGAVRVSKVVCRIGAMRQVVPELMHTAFEAVCSGTLAEGAELDIEIEPVHVTCNACGREAVCETVTYECPHCEAYEIRLEGGTDMLLTSISLELEDEHGHHDPAQRAGA